MNKSPSQFLATCPPEIKAAMQECSFQSGDIFMSQGDVARYVFILLEGEAKIYHLSLNGTEFLEYIYIPDELFGEVEILNEKPVICTVRASQPCRAIRLDRDAFFKWMEKDADFSRFIAGQLADKLYQSGLNAAIHIIYPLRYRVLYYLWNAAQQGNYRVRKGDVVSGLGSNERSINRVVRDLCNALLVDYEDGFITVSALEDIIREMKKFE